jgi:ABC-type proline/glycine betaine transport system ATPase subunit
MREHQRVGVFRELIAAQDFLSIDDLMATIVVDPETRVTEAA